LRNQYIQKTDVMNKVKLLTLLPDNEHMTVSMVAEYYEVEIKVIQMIMLRHKDEFEQDNVVILRDEELKKYKTTYLQDVGTLRRVNKLAIMPRRSILRIGMLLRDSEIAKQIRTYLLNVEEFASKEQRSKSMDHLGTWTPKEEMILLD